MKILLAVDGSKYSEAAVEEVAQRPWPTGTQVRVVTAVEYPVVTGAPMMRGAELWALPPEYYDEVEKAMRAGAEGIIKKAVEKLATVKELEISSEILSGSPKRVIIETADSWEADLIVVGSRGLGAWTRLLLGSVSVAIVSHAHCSVLIVRRRGDSEEQD